MKLGNFITLSIFTLVGGYLMYDGYLIQSSEFLFGVIIISICLFYWTSYLNRYKMTKDETKRLRTNNSVLNHKLQMTTSDFKLTEEINKLNNQQIVQFKETLHLQSLSVKQLKDSINSRNKIIKTQEKIIKELSSEITTTTTTTTKPVSKTK